MSQNSTAEKSSIDQQEGYCSVCAFYALTETVVTSANKELCRHSGLDPESIFSNGWISAFAEMTYGDV